MVKLEAGESVECGNIPMPKSVGLVMSTSPLPHVHTPAVIAKERTVLDVQELIARLSGRLKFKGKRKPSVSMAAKVLPPPSSPPVFHII
jgi:hypothetical protein